MMIVQDGRESYFTRPSKVTMGIPNKKLPIGTYKNITMGHLPSGVKVNQKYFAAKTNFDIKQKYYNFDNQVANTQKSNDGLQGYVNNVYGLLFTKTQGG